MYEQLCSRCMMVLSRSFRWCPRIRLAAVAGVHLRFSSLLLYDQFSSVAVDGHCREYGCIVHVSTQCRSYRYVQLSVVMFNDVYLLAIRFGHQSASID